MTFIIPFMTVRVREYVFFCCTTVETNFRQVCHITFFGNESKVIDALSMVTLSH